MPESGYATFGYCASCGTYGGDRRAHTADCPDAAVAPSVAPGPMKDVGFAFSRALRDPVLRDRLRAVGFDGHTSWVLPATDSTSIADLLYVIEGEPGRYLIVRQSEGEPGGWHMVWFEVPA